jgi:SAM-dependent methyltransferase
MTTRPVDTLLRELSPDSVILDVGCGTGRHARELVASGGRVIAVDMDFDAVETGRELSETRDPENQRTHAVRPSFVAARAEALPFRRGVFDAVLCVDVLHWAPDAAGFEALCRAAWDALAPGGIFLARLLLVDRLPDAAPLKNGRHRLASGAEWFLPTERRVRELLALEGGEPEIIPDGNEGAAWIRSRKIL